MSHPPIAMAEIHANSDVTQGGARSIPTITVAHANFSKQNLRATLHNERTLVASPPSLIDEEDSRSETSCEEDFEPSIFTLEKLRGRLDRGENKFNRQLARLTSINEGETKWSGTGEILDVGWETIEPKVKEQLDIKEEPKRKLGEGGMGIVYKVKCRKIAMARKTMVATTDNLSRIKSEIATTSKLAESKHRHLIKLVGVYRTTDEKYGFTLYHILTFPVAYCDLEKFLKDCEVARKADYEYGQPETQHILRAAAAVDIQ